MHKLLIISGQTATGKTDLGIDLAKKFNGELVSFDSRQAYQYLDVITGKEINKSKVKNQKFPVKRDPALREKVTNKNIKLITYLKEDVPIWLYDLVDAKEYLNAYEFCKIAEMVIKDIISRGKLPIIVGGTVFYIKVFLEGFDSIGIAPDWEARARFESLTVDKLQQKLAQADRERFLQMNDSDKKNKRRLIRALEIAQIKSLNIKMKNDKSKLQNAKKYDVLFLALVLNKQALKDKILLRINKRIKQGAIEEISDLLSKGYVFDDPGLNTIGYKQLRSYVEGKTNLDQALISWLSAEVNYAKRQLVFLKKMPGVHFLNPDEKDLLEKTYKLVYKWYNDTKD